MDPDLPGCHDDDAIRYAGDVRRAIDVAGNDEGTVDALEHEAGEGSAAGGDHGHVDNAVADIGQATRGSGTGGSGGQDNVQARLAENDNLLGRRKARGADARRAWLRHFLVVVLGLDRGQIGHGIFGLDACTTFDRLARRRWRGIVLVGGEMTWISSRPPQSLAGASGGTAGFELETGTRCELCRRLI